MTPLLVNTISTRVTLQFSFEPSKCRPIIQNIPFLGSSCNQSLWFHLVFFGERPYDHVLLSCSIEVNGDFLCRVQRHPKSANMYIMGEWEHFGGVSLSFVSCGCFEKNSVVDLKWKEMTLERTDK